MGYLVLFLGLLRLTCLSSSLVLVSVCSPLELCDSRQCPHSTCRGNAVECVGGYSNCHHLGARCENGGMSADSSQFTICREKASKEHLTAPIACTNFSDRSWYPCFGQCHTNLANFGEYGTCGASTCMANFGVNTQRKVCGSSCQSDVFTSTLPGNRAVCAHINALSDYQKTTCLGLVLCLTDDCGGLSSGDVCLYNATNVQVCSLASGIGLDQIPSVFPSVATALSLSSNPSQGSSSSPTVLPSAALSSKPSSSPSNGCGSAVPLSKPSATTSILPSSVPSIVPSVVPTSGIGASTSKPSRIPSAAISTIPSNAPSAASSSSPPVAVRGARSTRTPSTNIPSIVPSIGPTGQPSAQPSQQPSSQPRVSPSLAIIPIVAPSLLVLSPPRPSVNHYGGVSMNPIMFPTALPSSQLSSSNPSGAPSNSPSEPLISPSASGRPITPSAAPSHTATVHPAALPVIPVPTKVPSSDLVASPSALFPTGQTVLPSPPPTFSPSLNIAPSSPPSKVTSGCGFPPLQCESSSCTNVALLVRQSISTTDVAAVINATAAFRCAVADMTGLSSDAVTITSFDSRTTASTRHSLASSIVVVYYSISFSMEPYGYTSMDTAVATMNASIVINNSSGNSFDEYFYAASGGVSVTTTSVVITGVIVLPVLPSGSPVRVSNLAVTSSSEGSMAYLYISIAAVVVFFVALGCSLNYCYRYRLNRNLQVLKSRAIADVVTLTPEGEVVPESGDSIDFVFPRKKSRSRPGSKTTSRNNSRSSSPTEPRLAPSVVSIVIPPDEGAGLATASTKANRQFDIFYL